MRTLKTIHRAVLILIMLVVPSTAVQRPQSTAPPDFYVQLTDKRTVFYSDEGIQFAVMLRANKKVSPNCDLGGRSKIQVLRNGNVIASFTPGPVSMLAHSTLQGVLYVSYSWGLSRQDFLDNLQPGGKKIEIAPDETFQFRAFCGDEASEPSRPFHISEWQRPVDGLQVFLTPLQKSYKIGEPIKISVTMRNIGRTPKRCPVPLDDDGRGRKFWKLEPHWLDSRPYPYEDVMYERSLKILRPGESRQATFTLNSFRGTGVNEGQQFGGREGTYQVWFSVFFEQEEEDVPAKYRTNLWRADLSTNIIELVVRK